MRFTEHQHCLTDRELFICKKVLHKTKDFLFDKTQCVFFSTKLTQSMFPYRWKQKWPRQVYIIVNSNYSSKLNNTYEKYHHNLPINVVIQTFILILQHLFEISHTYQDKYSITWFVENSVRQHTWYLNSFHPFHFQQLTYGVKYDYSVHNNLFHFKIWFNCMILKTPLFHK